MDPRQYLRSFWRRKWLFLGIVLVLPAGVYIVSTLLPTTYEAKATLRVQATTIDAPPLSNQLTITPSQLKNAAALIETTTVAKEAARQLEDPSAEPAELLSKINIEPVLDEQGAQSDLLTITVRDSDPERVAEIANAFGRAIETIRARDAIAQIDDNIANLEDQFRGGGGSSASRTALAQQLQTLRGVRAVQGSNTETIEPAAIPRDPVSPKPLSNTALAALLSLLLGIGVVGMADRLDRRVRDPSELEAIVGVPLLSVIPDAAFPGRSHDDYIVEESFQTLRASLTYFNVDQPLSSVMVTSPTRGDGKTTVATHLAIALAKDGSDVILIDADLRRLEVAVRTGIERTGGLPAVLVGKERLSDALVRVEVGAGRLRVLAGGSPPPNPARLIGSERMGSLLAKLSEGAPGGDSVEVRESRIVVIDTPPILAVSDAVPLLNQVSGVVLVGRLDYTSRDALARVNDIISAAKGEVLGVVASGAKGSHHFGYAQYAYYGSRGQPEPGRDGGDQSGRGAANADQRA